MDHPYQGHMLHIGYTVSEVKKRHRLRETTATNGPEGTVFNKTQVSLKLLEEGMYRLHNSMASINNDYLEDVLCSLFTTVVNIRAVSHFKHETITTLQYSQDFGMITKESVKRVTKWAANYFTHEKSYYPVPLTSKKFVNFTSTRRLPSEGINTETECAMKEFVEKYRSLRRRTVQEETTKDKAGAIPLAVYTKQQDSIKVDLLAELGNDFNSGDQPVGLSSDKGEFKLLRKVGT